MKLTGARGGRRLMLQTTLLGLGEQVGTAVDCMDNCGLI
jgi:hypothetical protein